MIQPSFTSTPAADKFIRRMVRFSDHPSGGLRLTVTEGGCSGYNAAFSVEAEPAPGDRVASVNGLKVFMPSETCLLLDGVIVDFADTPTQSGLTFTNPSAAPCACSSADTGAPSVARVEVGAIKLHGHRH